MAIINRAPFNALVDDNGSGLTGSVWNKAAIAGSILDPVDAGISAPWVDWTLPAANLTNDGGVPQPFVQQHNRWRPIGNNTVLWSMGLNPVTLTGPSNQLYVIGPPFAFAMPATFIANIAFSAQLGIIKAAHSSAVTLARWDGGNWNAGNNWFFFTILIEATT